MVIKRSLKALKLKPLPRAYTKVDCHLPTTTTTPTYPEVSIHLTNDLMLAR